MRSIKLFIIQPEIVFRYLHRRPLIFTPLLLCILSQTVIAGIPDVIMYHRMNAPLLFGVLSIVAVSYSLKALVSAAIVKMQMDMNSGSKPPVTFSGLISSVLFCLSILLSGKLFAVSIGVYQYYAWSTEIFVIPSLPTLASVLAVTGWQAPKIFMKADIFTLLYIRYQACYLRTVTSMNQMPAIVTAIFHWFILIFLQSIILHASTML